MRKYTQEEKRTLLGIVNAFGISDNKISRNFFLCGILSDVVKHWINPNSWQRNIKRWRAELEPVPYRPTSVMKALSSMD